MTKVLLFILSALSFTSYAMSDPNNPQKGSAPQASWWSADVNAWSTEAREGANNLARKGGIFLTEGGSKALENIKTGASLLDSGGLIQESIQGLRKWVPKDINRLTTEASQTTLGFVKDRKAELESSELSQEVIQRFNHAKDLAVKVHYAEIPPEALKWVKANPKTVAVLVASGVITFYPAVVSKPLLWSIGFVSTGPRAASAASAYQAAIGNVPVRSLFAYLESAGAGGYGATSVNAAVRAGAVAAGVWGLDSAGAGEYGAAGINAAVRAGAIVVDAWLNKVKTRVDNPMVEAGTVQPPAEKESMKPLDAMLNAPVQKVLDDESRLGPLELKSGDIKSKL